MEWKRVKSLNATKVEATDDNEKRKEKERKGIDIQPMCSPLQIFSHGWPMNSALAQLWIISSSDEKHKIKIKS